MSVRKRQTEKNPVKESVLSTVSKAFTSESEWSDKVRKLFICR